jgi:hypothetical protein
MIPGWWWLAASAVLVVFTPLKGASFAHPLGVEVPFQPVYAVGDGAPTGIEPSTRLALVIGNDKYPGRPLKNAGDDATRVAASLQHRGFTLIGGNVQLDKTMSQSRALFEELVQAAAKYPHALIVIYFAGHGAIAGGHNTLAPIDADLAGSGRDGIQTLSVTAIAERLRISQAALTVMFLDDCRDSNRADNERFVPEQFPDNTFVGFSTRLGGVAIDEESGYSRALAASLDHGFDTLAKLHVSLIEAVAGQAPGDQVRPMQLPVFSVGRHMPARPIRFYPAFGQSSSRSTQWSKLDVGLAKQCDEASYAVSSVVYAVKAVGSVPSYVPACRAAWANGWRSREVLRGFALALAFETFRSRPWDSSPMGYMFQAAEMGDATALNVFLFSTMIGGGGDGHNMSKSEEGIDNYLIRLGVNLTGINVNNVDTMISYALERILNSDDEDIAYLWAFRGVAKDLGGIEFVYNEHYIFRDQTNYRIAQRKLIELADNGYEPGVVAAYALRKHNVGWISGVSIRQDMEKAVTRHFSFNSRTENLDVPQEDRLTLADREHGFALVSEGLFHDMLEGQGGPANPASAVELALRVERQSKYLTLFEDTGPLECYILGVLLVNGQTTGGTPVRKDVATGLRLLRYSAEHGVRQARVLLETAGVR